ncbi:hypothetical protein [Paenibacillus sp. NPDC058071]|uniref:hypothetical protein n=1 Tax=Paenibacillus sp. NPDC058071 TaxID=3346326 RepID=UPI0036D8E037
MENHRLEAKLTAAAVTKIMGDVWEPARRNSDGEMVLKLNLHLAWVAWGGTFLLFGMSIASTIAYLIYGEEATGIDLTPVGILWITALLIGAASLIFIRCKAIVNDTTIRVHTMFKVKEIDFADIQKMTVWKFPSRFVLHGTHHKVRMQTNYKGTGEFITLLHDKIGYEKSKPAIVFRDLNKEQLRRYSGTNRR